MVANDICEVNNTVIALESELVKLQNSIIYNEKLMVLYNYQLFTTTKSMNKNAYKISS